jgi:hypothetical protein
MEKIPNYGNQGYFNLKTAVLYYPVNSPFMGISPGRVCVIDCSKLQFLAKRKPANN